MAGSVVGLSAKGVDVALRDGSTVHVRATTPADGDAVAALIAGLSSEERWLRFMSSGSDPRVAAEQLLQHGWGLVATAGPQRVVGHACLVPEGDARAEIAFEVADAWQGRGSRPCCSRTWSSLPRSTR